MNLQQRFRPKTFRIIVILCENILGVQFKPKPLNYFASKYGELIFNNFLQDLQSEIETHRVVYDRLDGTGRKLLGSLTSQEDAVMLQRRLDEMNQRWNHLKSKSIAIR